MGAKTTSAWKWIRFASILIVAVLLPGPSAVLGDVCDDQFNPPDRILFLTDDFEGGTIYAYDAQAGVIVDSFPTPEPNVGLGQGLAYSQLRCSLYYTNGTGPAPTLYELDSLTGQVLNSSDALADPGYPVMGLGVGQIDTLLLGPPVVGDTFLLTNTEDRGDGLSQILIHDPDTLAWIFPAGAVLNQALVGQAALAATEDNSNEPFTGGIAYFTRTRTENHLDAIAWDPFAVVGRRFPTPTGAAGADQIGLGFDGRTLYMSRSSIDGLFVYDLNDYFSEFVTPIVENAFIADPTPGGPITGIAGGFADSDCDGVINSVDNCVCDSDPLQLDSDADGVGDACDNCPLVANPDQVDSDGNGIGDLCDAPVLCEPLTQGYWHRQCLGAGLIDPGRNGRGPQTVLEANFLNELVPAVDLLLEASVFEFHTCEDGMDADPESDPCERALKQFTALLLNGTSGKLPGSCEVDLAAEGCSSTNTGDLAGELAALINNGQCTLAADCAAAVNEGTALESAGLLPIASINTNTTPVTLTGADGSRSPAAVPTPTGKSSDAEAQPVVLAGAPARASSDDVGNERAEASPREAEDDRQAIQRHLATLADPSSSEEATGDAADALLTALSGGHELEARIEMAAGLLDRIDESLRSLLAEHLRDIRAEAEDFAREEIAARAGRLLERLEADAK